MIDNATDNTLQHLPKRGDSERKRVLNVLAQRRYRQRKRERLLALEIRANALNNLQHAGPLPVSEMTNIAVSSTVYPSQQPEAAADLSLNLDSDHNDMLFGIPPTMVQENGNSWSSITDTNIWTAISNPFDDGTHEMPPTEIGSFSLSSPTTSTTFNDLSNYTEELQDLETTQYQFPDDSLIEVPELKVLRVGFEIAALLNCQDLMWDLTALRTFDQTMQDQLTPLPPNLIPTNAQKQIPHHPLFDILPWPSVRSKLIYVFAQPLEMRPPNARDDLALVHFVQDLEDPSEGLRVSGSDGFSAANWEIGQVFFQNWWWAFDRDIIQTSNALRAMRGAGKLRL